MLEKAQVIIHGTTVATNTLVEKKGAKVGLITTEGFRDLLEIREGLKEDRYNLRMDQVEPLAPRYLRVGVAERVDAGGKVRRELDVDGLRKEVEYLKSEGVDSVAICFLFSFLNPDHEMEAERIVREMLPDAYVSASMLSCHRLKSSIDFRPLPWMHMSGLRYQAIWNALNLGSRMQAVLRRCSLFSPTVALRPSRTVPSRLSGRYCPAPQEAQQEQRTSLANSERNVSSRSTWEVRAPI